MKNNFFNLILATSIVIGIVLGVGIFFQNENIIVWSKGRAAIVLTGWIIGSIISLFITFSFIEIARNIKMGNSGIGEFASATSWKKFGWHTKMSWPFFYYPFFVFIVSSYIIKFIIQLIVQISKINPKVSFHLDPSGDFTIYILVFSLILTIGFILVNIYAKKIAKILQINLTIIKLVPLILLVFAGFITLFMLNKYDSWWSSTNFVKILPKNSTQISSNSFLPLLLLILPAILFSFDGSISVTNLANDIKKRKHIYFALIVGMSIVSFIYIFVTLAILNTGTLNVTNAIIKIFHGDINHPTLIYSILAIIIKVFVIIAGLAALNGLSLSWIRGIESTLLKPTNIKILIFAIGTTIITFIIPLGTITLIVDYGHHLGHGIVNENIYTIMAMNVTIIVYSIYSLIILNFLYQLIKNREIRKKFNRFFFILGPISVCAIFFIVSYQFGYVFMYNVFKNIWSMIGNLYAWIYLIISFVYIILYIIFPFLLNKMFKNTFIKKVNYNYRDNKNDSR